MNIKKNKTAAAIAAIYLLLLGFLIWFSLQPPMELDDWAWGGNVGLDRLKNWFWNYNGRYLGNLAIIGITRNVFLRVVVVASSIFAVIIMPYAFMIKRRERDNISLLLSCMIVFFALPRVMFHETYGFFAGFTNFVLPIPFLLCALVLSEKAIEHGKNNERYPLGLFLLPVGLAAATITEHNTIYIAAYSVFVLIFTLIRYKRIFISNVLLFIGSAAGAFLMFSNPAYWQEKISGYKSISFNIVAILKKYLTEMSDRLLFNNILINITLGIAILILLERAPRSKPFFRIRAKKFLCESFTVAFVLYDIIRYIKPSWDVFSSRALMVCINAVLALLFYLLALYVFLSILDDNKLRIRLLFLFFSAFFVSAPLLVVDPISPRCFLSSYVFFGCFALQAAIGAAEECGLRFSFTRIAVPAVLVVFIYYFSIFDDIGKAYRLRLEHMYSDVENGATEIYFDKLPYEEYIYEIRVTDEEWLGRLRDYYVLPEDIKIKWR